MDLTEKMAFFEAYGSIAGANGLKALSAILLQRGLLKMKEPPETRACAAMALGRIKTPEARDVLQRALDDKELVVRNAVNRALREPAIVTQPTEPAEGRSAPEGQLRQGGRSLLLALYAALRSLKLYPVENATVQKALDDLDASARVLLEVEGDLEIRMAGDFIFVNATRLRVELDNYASFSHILAMLRAFEIGVLRIHKGMQRREWQVFLSLLLSLSERGEVEERLEELQDRLDAGQVKHLEVERASAEGGARRSPVRRPSGSTPRAWPSPGT